MMIIFQNTQKTCTRLAAAVKREREGTKAQTGSRNVKTFHSSLPHTAEQWRWHYCTNVKNVAQKENTEKQNYIKAMSKQRSCFCHNKCLCK